MKNSSHPNWPPKHIWQLKTKPTRIEDYFLEFLLHPLMLWRANGKLTHWWHWRKFEGVKLKGQKLKDVKENFSAKTFKDHVQKSLGGWKRVYIVYPDVKKAKEGWYFAFLPPWGKQVQRCSITLFGPIRVLIGPGEPVVYGLDKEGKEIKIKVEGSILRADKGSNWPII